MALTKQSVTVTMPDPDTVQIQIGPQGFAVPVSDLRKRRNGQRTVEDLLFQFEVVLQTAGVNPNTATLAQVKAAIEAQQFWWGNT